MAAKDVKFSGDARDRMLRGVASGITRVTPSPIISTALIITRRRRSCRSTSVILCCRRRGKGGFLKDDSPLRHGWHSRRKDGVASARLYAAIHAFSLNCGQDFPHSQRVHYDDYPYYYRPHRRCPPQSQFLNFQDLSFHGVSVSIRHCCHRSGGQ